MTSKTTVLFVVIGLGLFAIGSLAGAVVLVALDKSVPDQLWTLAGVAVGALGSVLASTRSTLGPNDSEPSTVTLSSPTPVAMVTPQLVEPGVQGP